MALFLFLLLVAVVLGIIGAVADGLFYLLLIGIVVLLVDLVLVAAKWRRSRRQPQR
ncbi:hypothetical protein ACFV3E_44250 [Streptomyces sp. NPDC059718]